MEQESRLDPPLVSTEDDLADTTMPPLGQLSTTRTPIQQIYSQSTSPPTHCQTITNPPIFNPMPICDKCMPIKGLFLNITNLSPSTQLMSILHNTTGQMCLFPGKLLGQSSTDQTSNPSIWDQCQCQSLGNSPVLIRCQYYI